MKDETVSLEVAIEMVLSNGPTFETIAGLCKMAVEAAKEQHMTQLKVQLLVKQNYGNQALYPHNDAAHIFAAIANTKTITMETVKHIMALGYAVEYVHGEVRL